MILALLRRTLGVFGSLCVVSFPKCCSVFRSYRVFPLEKSTPFFMYKVALHTFKLLQAHCMQVYRHRVSNHWRTTLWNRLWRWGFIKNKPLCECCQQVWTLHALWQFVHYGRTQKRQPHKPNECTNRAPKETHQRQLTQNGYSQTHAHSCALLLLKHF